tara:strand:+ start:1 stop:2196 length:2196 start_codon:yes stop_codon:yes gene_type:complete
MPIFKRIEFVNKKESEYVSSLTKDEFFEMFPRPLKSIKGCVEKSLNNNEYFRMVIQYIHKHKFNDYKGIPITYAPSSNNPDGRMFVKDPIGLQRIHSELRSFLTRGLYHDYDMKNAHPSILCFLCEERGLPTTHQRNYLRNRKQLLVDAGVEKSVMLMKLNTDDARFPSTKSKELHDIVCEWNECKKKLFEENKDTVSYKKDKNPISSLVNSMMCQQENKLLHSALPENENLVLMFDGFMSMEEMDYESFPNEVVEWDEKPVVSDVQIPDDFVADQIPKQDYEGIKKKFEETHAKIIKNSCFIMINPQTKNITYKTKSDMITSYEHMKYTAYITKGKVGGFVELPFITSWLTDPDMRCYIEMDCYPNEDKCPPDVFNTWTPFSAELFDECEIDNDAVNMFVTHIEILCNNDKEVANVILKWLAHMFQYPEYKSFFPTFVSKEGSGKGTIIDLLRRLMGEKKVLETQKPLVDVFGNHNAMMAQAYLVIFDEVTKSDMSSVEGQLKGLVTEGTMTINPKGKDQYILKSYHRFCGTSNGLDPMPTTNGDRRKYLIKCSDELINNSQYFNDFHSKILDNNTALYSIYKYLLNYKDVPTTFKVLDFPKTAYQEILKEASRDYLDTWLEDFTHRHDDEIEVKMTSKEVYDDWKVYVNNNDIKITYSSIQFSKRLSLLNIDGVSSAQGSKGIRFKCFDVGKLKNKYMVGCQVVVKETIVYDSDLDSDGNTIYDDENDG